MCTHFYVIAHAAYSILHIYTYTHVHTIFIHDTTCAITVQSLCFYALFFLSIKNLDKEYLANKVLTSEIIHATSELQTIANRGLMDNRSVPAGHSSDEDEPGIPSAAAVATAHAASSTLSPTVASPKMIR